MPETRKHYVQARDQLDQAIFAALGEPVLPHQPGSDSETTTKTPDSRAGNGPASFTTGGTMGHFTFHAKPKPQPEQG